MCVSAGKLYAVGGYDGASRQCLSTVEEYDPVTNQWCYVADMSTRRSGAGTHAVLRTTLRSCKIKQLFTHICTHNVFQPGTDPVYIEQPEAICRTQRIL